MLLHPGGSEDWRSQHFHAVFRHEISHGVGALFVHRYLPDLIKKLLKPTGLAHENQLSIGCGCVRPHVRDAAWQPDAPASQQTVFFASRSKEEFTRQNVIPLVFAMMNVEEWARAWQSVQLKN